MTDNVVHRLDSGVKDCNYWENFAEHFKRPLKTYTQMYMH